MQGSARIGGTVSLLTAVLAFQLAGCADTQIGPREVSALSIRVTVSGVDTDDGLLISLDGAVPQVVSPIWGLVLRSIASGAHTITVSDLGKNCTLDGPNPLVVNVVPGGVGNVDFRVTCTATTGVIAASVTVSGSTWPFWFHVQVDTAPPAWIRANQKTLVGSFAGGAHVVRLVDVPTFCRLVGYDSTTVSIKTGGITKDTALVNFDLNCDSDPVPYGSGDSAVIAFQRGDDIAVVREDGSNTQLLVPGATPSWSPDGQFLAFQRRRCVSEWGCTGDLWMIRTDGSGVRPITTSEGFDDSDPAVSPDGRRVAFIRFWNGPDQSYLMVSDLSSTSPMVLSIWNPFSTPTWSPDGTQIAFTCEPGGPPDGSLGMCVVNAAGGCASYFPEACPGLPTVVHLTDNRFGGSEPAWSPDGQRIAFTLSCFRGECPAGADARETYIALLDPLTRAFTPLVPGSSPAWSPDGKRIVFAGNATNPGLNVINLDGTVLRRLTDDASDTAPSWR